MFVTSTPLDVLYSAYHNLLEGFIYKGGSTSGHQHILDLNTFTFSVSFFPFVGLKLNLQNSTYRLAPS